MTGIHATCPREDTKKEPYSWYARHKLIAMAGRFLLAAIPLLPLAAPAQTPELYMEAAEITVGEAMNRIEARTDYTFAYNKSAIDLTRRVTISGGRIGLQDLLGLMFRGSDFTYRVNGNHIILLPYREPPVREEDLPPLPAQVMPDTDAPAETGSGDEWAVPPVGEPYMVANGPQKPDVELVAPKAATLRVRKSGETSLSPRFAVKTNLLLGATATMNLGFEVRISPNWTAAVTGSYNPWSWSGNREWKNTMVSPEFRYWTGEPFSGYFIGSYARWAHFSIADLRVGSLRGNRYRGNLYGVGFTHGYGWSIGRRWTLEAMMGVGYDYMEYRKSSVNPYGTGSRRSHVNYVGLTKLGLNVSFLIK